MRYAIITETYPPEVNGVALTVQAMEQGLRARGHDVTVVRPRQPNDSPSKFETLVPGLGLPRYPGLRFGLPASSPLLRAWTAAPPDAIYVATEGPLGWSALRVARRLKIPAATGFHTRYDQYMDNYGLGLIRGLALNWMRRFHNLGQATLVPTNELRCFLLSERFNNPVLLPRAVDTQLFHPSRRDSKLRVSWGLDDTGLAIVHIGRIASEKNLELAVRAFRAIQANQPHVRFVLVGDGPLREQLQRSNPDFIFCGVQKGESLATHFASGDLFLFPSRTETFGNVTLEAMASGVTTVAFDRGAARESIRNGVHGATVPDGDEKAFIEACERLAREPVLRGSMAVAARESMLRLKPEHVSANFEHVLTTLTIGEAFDANFAQA
jgi:glycosyltransferase involved in cell wall biosynthesis